MNVKLTSTTKLIEEVRNGWLRMEMCSIPEELTNRLTGMPITEVVSLIGAIKELVNWKMDTKTPWLSNHLVDVFTLLHETNKQLELLVDSVHEYALMLNDEDVDEGEAKTVQALMEAFGPFRATQHLHTLMGVDGAEELLSNWTRWTQRSK